MKALVQAMMVLGITNLSIAIDVNGVTVDQLRDTHYLGLGTDPVLDTYESRIIHRLLSDAIDNAVTVPDDAYMSVDMLDMLPGEVGALIEALAEMGLTTLTDPIDVNTLTVAQLRNIHYLGLKKGDFY